MKYNPFGGGLWIIIAILAIAALYSFYRGLKQSKSGSLESIGGKPTPSDKNVPFYKCPATIYGYLFTIAAVVASLVMYSER